LALVLQGAQCPREILHDQAPYWGRKGIPYHQFLKAGENTLNVVICRILMAAAASLIISLSLAVLAVMPLRSAITDAIDRQIHPFLGHPFRRWLLNQPDEEVIGRHLSTACYVDHAIPEVVCLALKSHDDPENALVVNTNLCGVNAARGAVLRALLGAENGIDAFPCPWITGLLNPPPETVLIGIVKPPARPIRLNSGCP
jgi:hypothetical protein